MYRTQKNTFVQIERTFKNMFVRIEASLYSVQYRTFGIRICDCSQQGILEDMQLDNCPFFPIGIVPSQMECGLFRLTYGKIQ